MSAVTVKKPYGCGDKGPPEPLSPAAQWDEPLTATAPLSHQEAVEGMFIVLNNRNIISSSFVAPPQHWEGLAFCLLQNWPFSPVCSGGYSFCLWFNSPSRQQHRIVHSQWQCDKTCTSCHCRHWRTWAVSGRREGSGLSCALLLCWETTTVYDPTTPPGICRSEQSLSPLHYCRLTGMEF